MPLAPELTTPMWDLCREEEGWWGGLQDRETAWAILETVLSREGVLVGLVSAAMSGPEHQAAVLGIQSLLAEEPPLVFWQVALLWWPSLGCLQVVLLCP
jgi:hypothetical protein